MATKVGIGYSSLTERVFLGKQKSLGNGVGVFTGEKEYHCSGCDWDGCSVLHNAKLSYKGASDIFIFETSTGHEIYFDRNTIKTFLELANDDIFGLNNQ